MRRLLSFGWLLLLASCAPPACSESPERVVRGDVKLLVADDGALADAARQRLVGRGRDAISVLETGLYAANAPARLRIVRTLAEIGSPEALPILVHLGTHDPNPEVREAAERAISSLPPGGPAAP